MKADRQTLFDLIATINDNRRSLDAAALHSRDPVHKARCRQLSRRQAQAVSRITRDIAQREKNHATLPGAQLERYVDSLIDAYTDEDDDSSGLGARVDARPVSIALNGPPATPGTAAQREDKVPAARGR